MKTNREKYDYYCNLIAARDAEAIKAFLPNGVPPQFFTIEKYEARPIDVTGVNRYRRGFYVKAADARITRKDVDSAANIANDWDAPAPTDIMVHYSYKQTYGTVSGAHPYPKIGDDVSLAWDAEALMPEIERRRELYADRDGHKPCTYCRKQVPEQNMVSRTIFYRDHGGSARKTCMYCSEQCGYYDQCGHEG